MVPSAMARPAVTNNAPSKPSRLGDYSTLVSRPGAEERASSMSLAQGIGNGAKGWGTESNIWASGFGASTRESSRTRGETSRTPHKEPPLTVNAWSDTGAFAASKEVIEGKTGSSSLVPSSETEGWSRQRSPWEAGSSTGSHMRSSGVSPVRRGSSQLHPAHSMLDSSQHSSQYYPNARSSTAVGSKPTNGAYDSVPFGPRHSEGTISGNGYGHYSRSSDESSLPHNAIGSWADAGSVHSPTDDRRSVSNSDYFGASSAGASRSGSLPPSRHGNEPLQYSTADNYSRFPQTAPAPRGHTSSFSSISNGRFPERQNSQHSDSLPSMIGRMSLENSSDQALGLQRSSAGMNSNGGQSESSFLRNAHHDLSSNHDDAGMNGAGSFTPDGYPPAFHNPDPFQRFRYGERGVLTPSANEFRQPQFYSAGATPPVFDPLYSSRGEQPRTFSNAHPALLDRKLRGLQQEQQQPMLHHPPYQAMMAGPYRGQFNPYASHYSMQSPMLMNGMNGIGPGALMPSAPHTMVPHGMYPGMMEAPRGPKEQDASTMQSSLLVEFKASSKGNRRWELKDIYGYIVEFSGDQHGSRFIQLKLETANSDEKQIIFKELMPDVMQLMQDVFGNYVIQKFFEHGDQGQKKSLASKMKGQVVNLSLQMYGCRVVQKALEHVLTDQQASLAKELEPSVLRCVKDQNGNHVVQKAIERVPMEHIQFIIDSFVGKVGELAVHSYGCRVIQRVLEHCDERAKRLVLAELHACGSTLISDQYGNYVTQHIIEFGFPEDRARVIGLVTMNLGTFSKHKFASNVVEKCLVFGSTEQKRAIVLKIIERTDGESTLMQLIKDGYGNYVIQKLLETLNGHDYDMFVEHLQPELAKAKRTIAGKQVQAVEKKIHRNDRYDSPNMNHREIYTPSTAAASSNSPTQPHTSAGSTETLQINLPVPARPESLQTPRATAPPVVTIPTIGFTSHP